jgi:hypothetical protein
MRPRPVDFDSAVRSYARACTPRRRFGDAVGGAGCLEGSNASRSAFVMSHPMLPTCHRTPSARRRVDSVGDRGADIGLLGDLTRGRSRRGPQTEAESLVAGDELGCSRQRHVVQAKLRDSADA